MQSGQLGNTVLGDPIRWVRAFEILVVIRDVLE